MITAMPDIRKEKLGSETQFLIIACDGIWDCLTSQEAVDLVSTLMKEKEKLSDVIEEMFDNAEIELDEYRQHRQQEIEKNLIRMVNAVSQRVVEMSLDDEKHQELILKALEEVKAKRSRSK